MFMQLGVKSGMPAQQQLGKVNQGKEQYQKTTRTF